MYFNISIILTYDLRQFFFLNHILTKAELSYKIYYQIQNNAQHVYNNYINMSQAEKKAYELWPGKNKFYLKGKIMLG